VLHSASKRERKWALSTSDFRLELGALEAMPMESMVMRDHNQSAIKHVEVTMALSVEEVGETVSMMLKQQMLSPLMNSPMLLPLLGACSELAPMKKVLLKQERQRLQLNH